VQLMLLLGLCTIYLYNLRLLRVVDQLPDESKAWWQMFLVCGNMAMGGFVVAAVCTRFVFPTISLEGKAYWILRSGPCSLKSILRTKFLIWLVPVGSIATILLVSGAFAINADVPIILMSAAISWFMAYGIVGLAVGVGAVYANFDWEHSSQLAASFGSLIFMLTSTVLIGINLLPTSFLILIRTWKHLEQPISELEWYLAVAGCVFLLLYVNYATCRWALQIGQNALEDRER
ncbi:MAG: hypothetical protein KDD53_01070, partial [Bdellovibrionales bacterium]|nr:hypothetical protein [Bdellovibrionales bacterium]